MQYIAFNIYSFSLLCQKILNLNLIIFSKDGIIGIRRHSNSFSLEMALEKDCIGYVEFPKCVYSGLHQH